MIIKYSKPLLILIALITILSILPILKLKFNYDFESYFPANDEDLEYLIKYRSQYENDTDFLLIGIENSTGVLKKDFLEKVKSLSSSIQQLPNVRKIVSLTNLKLPIAGPAGIFMVPVVHPEDASKYRNDSLRLFQNNYLKGNIISADGKAINILIQHTQDIKKKAGDSLLFNIERLLQRYHFEKVHVAGKIKASEVYVKKMQTELIVFISASALLISMFLFVAYRSAWGIIVPLITVIISITWTLAIMSLLGKDLDLLTSLLPPILFVVAMSDMTHLISKYLEELRSGRPKNVALQTALKEVGWATFITAITTAIGFITLLNSSIRPIRDFGFYTAIGVFVAYTLAFSFLPAVLTCMRTPKIAKRSNDTLFWHTSLKKTLLWIFKNKFQILNCSITLMLLSLFFIFKIEVNSTILDDISDKDPLKQSVLFFEKKFGGIRPFEMEICLKDTSFNILDYRNLYELDQLETYLKREYEVNNIVSPLSMVKLLNQSLNGGLPEYYKLPEEEDFKHMQKKILLLAKRKDVRPYLSASGNRARISGKMKDIGSLLIAKKNAALDTFVSTQLNPFLFRYKLTGSATLIDKNNTYLAQSLIEDLIFGIFSIAVIIGFLFKSPRMVLLALVPNLIPLLVIGGVMGLFEIQLKASTSIIFSIAFGIAVDDSIHFLSRFKLELHEGKHFLYALKRTYISTGKAMLVTSLILISGFISLLFSTFEGTFYTGMLISLTLFIAIIADLILLPVLLVLFYRKH
jgi:predicted RND superfamily exporter protein